MNPEEEQQPAEKETSSEPEQEEIAFTPNESGVMTLTQRNQIHRQLLKKTKRARLHKKHRRIQMNLRRSLSRMKVAGRTISDTIVIKRGTGRAGTRTNKIRSGRIKRRTVAVESESVTSLRLSSQDTRTRIATQFLLPPCSGSTYQTLRN